MGYWVHLGLRDEISACHPQTYVSTGFSIKYLRFYDNFYNHTVDEQYNAKVLIEGMEVLKYFNE
jgi:hypothetical protein